MSANLQTRHEIGQRSLREWCALEYQACRELIPGPVASDEAAKIMLDALEGIAQQIGRERFHEMIVKALETCERRPTLATFRRLAGLNPVMDKHAEAVSAAWELVTRVVSRHLGRDGNGCAVLQPRIYRESGEFREQAIPVIPKGVQVAVASMGGWGALADSYPAYWGMRFGNFKELLRLSSEESAALIAPTTSVLATK